MKKIKSVLATGTGGMLGSTVVPTFREGGIHVLSTSRRKNVKIVDEILDVTNFEQYEKYIKKSKPEMLIHLAAETDLEYCENFPDKAFATNTIGEHNAALLSVKYDIPLVVISTAGIYDGTKKTPYNEFDLPSPINVYGNSKLQGEKFVKKYCKKYFIARAGWMVGGMGRDKKFVSHIVNQIVDGAKEIYAVKDKFGAPTYAPDFAKNLLELIQTPYYGVYNMVCEGNITRHDIAEEILKVLKLDQKIKLNEVDSDHFKQDFFAPRPRSEAMDNYHLKLRNLNRMRPWKDALSEYIKELYAKRLHKKTSTT